MQEPKGHTRAQAAVEVMRRGGVDVIDAAEVQTQMVIRVRSQWRGLGWTGDWWPTRAVELARVGGATIQSVRRVYPVQNDNGAPLLPYWELVLQEGQ
jgi:hypothetical protein